MTVRRALAIGVAFVLLTAPRLAAEPLPSDHAELTHVEGELHIPDRTFQLPIGTHILLPTAWSRLDVEMRRLQDQETRLSTENKYMKKRLDSWQPGWKTLMIATATGLATGVYIGWKL